MKWLFIILGLVLILALIGGAAWWFLSKNKSKTNVPTDEPAKVVVDEKSDKDAETDAEKTDASKTDAAIDEAIDKAMKDKAAEATEPVEPQPVQPAATQSIGMDKPATQKTSTRTRQNANRPGPSIGSRPRNSQYDEVPPPPTRRNGPGFHIGSSGNRNPQPQPQPQRSGNGQGFHIGN